MLETLIEFVKILFYIFLAIILIESIIYFVIRPIKNSINAKKKKEELDELFDDLCDDLIKAWEEFEEEKKLKKKVIKIRKIKKLKNNQLFLLKVLTYNKCYNKCIFERKRIMELILKKNELSIETLKKYEESFIDYLDVDDLTLKTYRLGIESFCNYLKEHDIKQPDRDDVISFRNYLRDTYSSNTVNTYMLGVRALFKYLKIHKIYDNIAEDIKGARQDTTPKKQVLSLEQIKTIYNSLESAEEKALWSLLFTTGIRGCELINADIEDIKYYNNQLVLFILGKKRDSKCEYVKISNEVLEDIKNYIGDRQKGAIFVSTSNHNKNGRLTTKSVRKKIKDIFKRFNLDDKGYSLHSTRRSFAVLSYEEGSSIYDIQQVLHHRSITTTTRYLQQVDRDKNNTEYNVSNILFNLKGGEV